MLIHRVVIYIIRWIALYIGSTTAARLALSGLLFGMHADDGAREVMGRRKTTPQSAALFSLSHHPSRFS